jgi:2-keto-3-deoxy-L-rhamnonate aldolase RhmA
VAAVVNDADHRGNVGRFGRTRAFRPAVTIFELLDGRRPGEALLGTFVKSLATESLDIVARCGVDFIIIDAEHSAVSLAEIARAISLCSALDLVCFVRVSDHGYGDPQRLLDAGASGILVPHVSSPAVADEVTRRMLFPPAGTRGLGFASRAGGWGRLDGGRDAYLAHGDRGVARIVMLEEPEAIEHVEEILAVPGVNAAFVGPGDLALALGVPSTDPEIIDCLRKAQTAAVKRQIPIGVAAPNRSAAKTLADEGFDFVAIGNDLGFFATSMADMFSLPEV